MNRKYPKTVVSFTGLLIPIKDEEEYKKFIKQQKLMVSFFCLSLGGIALFIMYQIIIRI